MIQNKESANTNFIRRLLACFVFLSLSCFMTCAIARYMVLNPYYWKTHYLTGDIRYHLAETLRDSGDFPSLDEDELQPVADAILDKMIDVMDGGEADFDEEWLDEFYDENLAGKGQVSREDFEKSINFRLTEFKNKIGDTDVGKIYFSVDKFVFIALIVSFCVTAIIEGILIAIHRNKYIPCKTFCLDLVWASVVNFFFWNLIRTIVGSATSSPEEGEWGAVLLENINKSLVIVLVICGIVFVLAIAGNIFLGKAAKLMDDNMDDVGESSETPDVRRNDYE